MTELLPGLYSVSVPEDATDIQLANHCLGFKSDAEFDRDTNGWCIAPLGLWAINKYQIIGTVTKNTITYDCTVYEDFEIMRNDISLRSIIEKKGQHFVNPMGDEMPILEPECCGFIEVDEMGFPQCCCQPVPTAESRKRYDDWHEAEHNLVKKLVIIKKVK